jgi:Protein of unknown function (DUF2934)
MPRAKLPRVTSASRKQVVTMPEAGTAPQVRSNGNGTTADLEIQIRQRAYELYEQRGCTPGQENDDWFRAEREILARVNHQQTA